MNNNDDFLEIFEKKLSKFTGAPYVVLTDRCTNAIFLSMYYKIYYENRKISEIVLPSHTYMSVPMTLKNLLNLNIKFEEIHWKKRYKVYDNIYDSAVMFEKDMYESGTIQCISFQQKKILPIGTGGAILLDDIKTYEILKKLSYDGRDRFYSDRELIEKNSENIICGFHMNMTPDQAAKGILLLNQPSQFQSIPNDWRNYSDLRQVKCFRGD